MLIVKPPSEEDEQGRSRRLPHMFGPGGYAIPREPIRVVLARDEEAAGIESETKQVKPPAYGLWRESVVSSDSRLPIIPDSSNILTLIRRGWTQIASSGNVTKKQAQTGTSNALELRKQHDGRRRISQMMA